MTEPNLERWLALWSRLGGKGDGRGVWTDLERRHHEPHRAYHNFLHIGHCLAEFDTVRHLAETPDAVELSIWFHDAVYDTHAKDNEEQSAQLAVTDLRSAVLGPKLEETVSALVLATKHSAPPPSPDAALLVDIDLAILGQPRERYEAFENEIHAEYAWVPPADFAKGRAAILRGFLDRPRIYYTDPLRDRWEPRARENMAWALGNLSTKI
jgi:predicted metal-dependent HD superfamily phosphohydrolase